MSESYTSNDLLNAIAAASKTLSERKDEINRLNVFPVPDGDTGTNMSLTLETVVENLAKLPIGAEGAEIRKAITTGALMGARGNSGVITSQILRGLCEGSVGQKLDAAGIDAAFSSAVEVAFQAVRKPVEGTILTVLRDSAAAAKRARKKKLSPEEALSSVVEEAYASVQRTPDLLPVLKENGVVDAGGFGLAIFFDAFASALTGREGAARRRTRVRPQRRSQGRDRADQRLGGIGVPLLHRVPRPFRRRGRGRGEGVSAHDGRLRPHGGHASQLQGARAHQPPRRGPRLVFGSWSADLGGPHPQHAAAKRRTHRRARGRGGRRAQAARLRGSGRRRGQREDPREPGRGRGGVRRPDHEPLHEGPARRGRRGQRRCRHHPAEQQEHHHGGPERVRPVGCAVRRRAHEKRARGVRGVVRLRRGRELGRQRRVDDRGVRGGENRRGDPRHQGFEGRPTTNPIKEGDVIGIADGSHRGRGLLGRRRRAVRFWPRWGPRKRTR